MENIHSEPFLFPYSLWWFIGVALCTLLLNLSATSKQGLQLLHVISDVSLHDVHAWAKQSLKGFNIHDLEKRQKKTALIFVGIRKSHVIHKVFIQSIYKTSFHVVRANAGCHLRTLQQITKWLQAFMFYKQKPLQNDSNCQCSCIAAYIGKVTLINYLCYILQKLILI